MKVHPLSKSSAGFECQPGARRPLHLGFVRRLPKLRSLFVGDNDFSDDDNHRRRQRGAGAGAAPSSMDAIAEASELRAYDVSGNLGLAAPSPSPALSRLSAAPALGAAAGAGESAAAATQAAAVNVVLRLGRHTALFCPVRRCKLDPILKAHCFKI